MKPGKFTQVPTCVTSMNLKFAHLNVELINSITRLNLAPPNSGCKAALT